MKNTKCCNQNCEQGRKCPLRAEGKRDALHPQYVVPGRATEGQAQTSAATERYTCIGKGGLYEYVGVAKGAGTSKYIEDVAVYRDCDSGDLFYRTTIDFARRMEVSPYAAQLAVPEGWKQVSHGVSPGGPIMAVITTVFKRGAYTPTYEGSMGGESWSLVGPGIAAAPLPQVQSEALDAKRYRFLRDQNIFAHIGSFSPYAVRGQTMEMLDGEELDKATDAAMADQQPVTPSGALVAGDTAN